MDKGCKTTLAIGVMVGLAGGALLTYGFFGAPVIAEEVAAPGPKVVSAQEFRLVDQHGRSRALLSFSASGDPSLTLLNQEGAQIVWLGLSEESGLMVRDVDGKTRILLGLDPSGQTTIILRDRQHRTHSLHP